jgi:heme exporter protein A
VLSRGAISRIFRFLKHLALGAVRHGTRTAALNEAISPALQLAGVARKFGRRWVLRGTDLEVGRGEIVALLGRNGSGKTTLLRVASTALRPTRGSVHVFGEDAVATARTVRPWIGVLGHHAGIYDELTAAENLGFALRMAGLRADRVAIEQVLAQVALDGEADELVRGFSAGMRRRLALARLLMRPPRLLLLDEPYASFDDDGIDAVNGFAVDVARTGGAVLVATHDLARGAGIFDRALRIEDGLAVAYPLQAQASLGVWHPGAEAVG